jgi:hypothetical protein
MNKMKLPRTIKLTQETVEILTEVLTMAQRTVDMQYDDDTALAMETLLIMCAETFGIESAEMTIEDHDDGSYTVTPQSIEPKAKPKRVGWTPKVIINNGPDHSFDGLTPTSSDLNSDNDDEDPTEPDPKATK